MPKVVVTMPAYRAELTLAKTVADIPPGVADQLILVDDASPDNTAQLARDLGIDVYVHPRNLGYGGNQKSCYTIALRDGADIVVLLHPDYQYEPKAVPLLIAPILAGHADMTFGSRFAGLGDPREGGMPIYRYVGNRVTTIFENFMLGSRFTEMHSGMRAYTRDCLLALPFLGYSDDFVFDSQILVDAVTSGLRVVEVPIPTRYTQESSSIDVGRSLRYIGQSLAYCARRSAERGRRGRRWPVADVWRQGAGSGVRRRSAGSGRSPAVGAIERIARYAVRGRRLLAAGPRADRAASAAEQAGWEARTLDLGAVPEPSAVADAVLLTEPDRALDELPTVRSLLDDEGLLALDSSRPLRPEAVRGALARAGFRMVEWEPRRGGGILVLARPGRIPA